MPKISITGKDQKPVAKVAFDLNRLKVSIGREESNDLVVTDNPLISSKHCIIRRVKGGYVLEDLNSSNGIYVNGARDEKVVLTNEKKITIGDAPLSFSYNEEELKALSEEELEPWEYLTESDLAELKNRKKAAEQKAPSVPTPLVPSSSAPSMRSRPAYKSSGSGVSPIGILICVGLGLLAGIFFKHSRTYDGGNIINDYKENVIQGAWE